MITTAILETARRTAIDPDKAATVINGLRFDDAEAIAVDAAEAAIKAIDFEIASSTDDPEIIGRLETMVMTYLVPSVILTDPDAADPIIDSVRATIAHLEFLA